MDIISYLLLFSGGFLVSGAEPGGGGVYCKAMKMKTIQVPRCFNVMHYALDHGRGYCCACFTNCFPDLSLSEHLQIYLKIS